MKIGSSNPNIQNWSSVKKSKSSFTAFPGGRMLYFWLWFFILESVVQHVFNRECLIKIKYAHFFVACDFCNACNTAGISLILNEFSLTCPDGIDILVQYNSVIIDTRPCIIYVFHWSIFFPRSSVLLDISWCLFWKISLIRQITFLLGFL